MMCLSARRVRYFGCTIHTVAASAEGFGDGHVVRDDRVVDEAEVGVDDGLVSKCVSLGLVMCASGRFPPNSHQSVSK